MDRLTGRTLGGFVVCDQIGAGGFGAVYRADQPLLGREAVIKVLRYEHRADKLMIQRFLREARLASSLDHPFAAHIYAFGFEPDGLLWIAMERVHGVSLRDWIKARGPLPLAELVPLVDRIAEVIHSAHERGIVHRDIKPSNVMVVERAGRLAPKLLDFGIAKTQHAVSAEPLPMPPPVSHARVPSGTITTMALEDAQIVREGVTPSPTAKTPAESGDTSLTAAGSLVGSPPYMAPERWTHAADTDARSDLYSLGVLVYEAMTGRRPFEAATLEQLRRAHAAAPVPPVGGGLPHAIDPVMARILAKRPDDRYSSALAFAAALRRAAGLDTARSPARAWLVAAAAIAAATAVVVALGSRTKGDPCAAAGDAVIDVFTPARRDAIGAAFRATGLAYAEDSRERVVAGLDARAAALRAGYTEVCRRTNVLNTQSPALMDRRIVCLDRRADEVRALASALGDADGAALERSVLAVAALSPVDDCLAESIASAPPPALRSRVASVSARLAAAKAQERMGRVAAARAVVAALTVEAEALGYPPLTLELTYEAGQLHEASGDRDLGARTLQQAALRAEAAGDDVIKAKAAVALVYLVGYYLSKPDEGMAWVQRAASTIERLGGDWRLSAQLASRESWLLYSVGKFPEAIAAARRGQALVLGHPPVDELLMAELLSDEGEALHNQGRTGEAIPVLREVLAREERALGSTHPHLIGSLLSLAKVYEIAGPFDEEVRLVEHALRIADAGLDPESPRRGQLLHRLGSALTNTGEFDRAIETLDRAVAFYETRYGPVHRSLSNVLQQRSITYHLMGRPDQAIADGRRLVAMRERLLGPEHADVGLALSNLGDFLGAAGRCAEAEPLFRRALPILEKLGPDQPWQAAPLAGLAKCMVERGEREAAITPLRRAERLLAAVGDPNVADVRFTLARALERRDPAQARSLAESALAEYRKGGKVFAREAANIEAWLRAR